MRFVALYDVPENEVSAIAYAAPRIVGPHDFVITEDPESLDTTLELEVEARNMLLAWGEVRRRYDAIRELARLPPRDQAPHLIPWQHSRERSDELLAEAHMLLELGHHALAVVAAQVACELEIQRYLRAGANGQAFGAVALVGLRWTLMDQRGRALFAAIAGHQLTDFDIGRAYVAHVQRRNDAVHRGTRLARYDAVASLNAVEDMVSFLRNDPPI